jgi:hypothetical protein
MLNVETFSLHGGYLKSGYSKEYKEDIKQLQEPVRFLKEKNPDNITAGNSNTRPDGICNAQGPSMTGRGRRRPLPRTWHRRVLVING